MLRELDERLKYGPGMRVQRIVEAGLFLAAFFTRDVRFAYVPFALTAVHALSKRLVPIAVAVALFVPAPREHRLGDIYFDLAAARGACAISVFIQAAGLWLVYAGHGVLGFLLLSLPTASFLLTPTLGFCCGSAVYVGGRDLLVKLGAIKGYPNGTCDIRIDGTETPRRQ